MLQQLAADQQIRLNPAIGQSWMVFLRVDDLDATHARLRESGYPASEIDETQYDTREFFVRIQTATTCGSRPLRMHR